MQHKVTSSLFVCLSENGFSLDELVYRMKDLYEKNAFGELLRHILLLVEEVLRLKVMQGKSVPARCECGCDRLVLNGAQARTIRTGLGDINFERVSRVKCVQCGKTFSMLMRLLGIAPHQSKTSELEKLVLEEVAGDSYRRAHKSVQRMTGVTAGRSTFHNWMLRTAADEISVPENVIGSVPGEIFADGTKCKSISPDGKPARGDIKVMIVQEGLSACLAAERQQDFCCGVTISSGVLLLMKMSRHILVEHRVNFIQKQALTAKGTN